MLATDVVSDANVALKWFRHEGEEDVESARALLDRHRERQVVLHVLDLTFYELGNALLRGRARATAEQTATVLGALREICPTIIPENDDLALASELAYYGGGDGADVASTANASRAAASSEVPRGRATLTVRTLMGTRSWRAMRRQCAPHPADPACSWWSMWTARSRGAGCLSCAHAASSAVESSPPLKATHRQTSGYAGSSRASCSDSHAGPNWSCSRRAGVAKGPRLRLVRRRRSLRSSRYAGCAARPGGWQ